MPFAPNPRSISLSAPSSSPKRPGALLAAARTSPMPPQRHTQPHAGVAVPQGRAVRRAAFGRGVDRSNACLGRLAPTDDRLVAFPRAPPHEQRQAASLHTRTAVPPTDPRPHHTHLQRQTAPQVGPMKTYRGLCKDAGRAAAPPPAIASSDDEGRSVVRCMQQARHAQPLTRTHTTTTTHTQRRRRWQAQGRGAGPRRRRLLLAAGVPGLGRRAAREPLHGRGAAA